MKWLKVVLFLLISIIPMQGNVYAKDFSLEIIKSEHILKIMDGNKVVKQYHCSLGRGGAGEKRFGGDNKTPVGNYKIVAMNTITQYHFFMYLSYPNVEDARKGLESGVINKKQFKSIQDAQLKNEIPPSDTDLGGYVGIHGLKNGLGWLGVLHGLLDWTKGCIAVTDGEIDEIKTYCKVGTVVVINE
jgi:murein L,D-transpeptidase YafK